MELKENDFILPNFKDDIGVSGVVGSAVFNITLVIAVCAIAAPRPFTLNWYSVCRYSSTLCLLKQSVRLLLPDPSLSIATQSAGTVQHYACYSRVYVIPRPSLSTGTQSADTVEHYACYSSPCACSSQALHSQLVLSLRYMVQHYACHSVVYALAGPRPFTLNWYSVCRYMV